MRGPKVSQRRFGCKAKRETFVMLRWTFIRKGVESRLL
jgi:hypothetical protein